MWIDTWRMWRTVEYVDSDIAVSCGRREGQDTMRKVMMLVSCGGCGEGQDVWIMLCHVSWMWKGPRVRGKVECGDDRQGDVEKGGTCG